MTSEKIASLACEALYAKKGNDIITLNVSEMTVQADYFVIASAQTSTQVRALAEHVEEEFSKLGIEPTRREGFRDGRWAVLDYGDVIVHVFNDESRMFYCLERLWESGDNLTKYEGK